MKKYPINIKDIQSLFNNRITWFIEEEETEDKTKALELLNKSNFSKHLISSVLIETNFVEYMSSIEEVATKMANNVAYARINGYLNIDPNKGWKLNNCIFKIDIL